MKEMTKVKFYEADKKMELYIKKYEFPMEEDMDEYDANWLTVGIDYSKGEVRQSYEDNCLLAFELEAFIEDLEEIIQGGQTGYISTFMEPYLRISVTNFHDMYQVQIRFVYDTGGDFWKEVYVCQEMSLKEVGELKESLRKLYAEFPVR